MVITIEIAYLLRGRLCVISIIVIILSGHLCPAVVKADVSVMNRPKM